MDENCSREQQIRYKYHDLITELEKLDKLNGTMDEKPHRCANIQHEIGELAAEYFNLTGKKLDP